MKSDGQESKSVLEFVAVGGEPTTPLYPVLNGGGNCHSLGGCSSRYADQREVIPASIPTIANDRNLAVWCAEACGGTRYHPAGHDRTKKNEVITQKNAADVDRRLKQCYSVISKKAFK